MCEKSFIEAMRALADKYHSDTERHKRETRMYRTYIDLINGAIKSAASDGAYCIKYEIKHTDNYGKVDFDKVVSDIVSYYKDFDVICDAVIAVYPMAYHITISWERKDNRNDGNTTENKENNSDNNN